jgi:hypothetical protein
MDPSMMSLESSFSRPDTVVLKADAMVFRSIELKGLKYWMRALFRIFWYRGSTCSCR